MSADKIIGKNGGQSRNTLLWSTKYHISYLALYKKQTGRHLECSVTECSSDHVYTIAAIMDIKANRFLTTVCCADHLDAGKAHFRDKKIKILKTGAHERG